ncbi:MAG: aromatic ring-hydroxylating dioxygenase subunit alpha [Thermoplasmata archaeon]
MSSQVKSSISAAEHGEPTAHLSQHTPDGRNYWDPTIFQAELDRFFYPSWLLMGRDDQIPNPGDFVTRQLGPENVFFIRDRAGEVHGFYNVCRHRGTRLLAEPEGTVAKSIVCPYHAWTYSLDGKLTAATHTRELVGFDRKEFGLYPVRLDRWGGFLFANLEPTGPTLRDQLGRFFDRFQRFPIADLKLGARHSYEIEANWKLLVENFSECYHCAPIHPELNRLTPYMTGDNDAFFHEADRRGNFSGGFMTFAKDYQSMTRSGYTTRPLIPGMTAEDKKRVYYYTLFPNTFFSIQPDYVMIHRILPQSPSHSRVENEFYFTREAVESPGFDPSDAAGLWDEINRQDWRVCELGQQGTHSRVWHGGRYSEQETLVCDFDMFVDEQLKARK